ncbi:FAD:protein FMN transferase [Nocardioides sp. BP30]|uniref:FAD:protein FMN transferase n=1 Tax=Nocardioides sp. BP30 TaxID=3036374 RepID=UPI002468AF53|nr:FAD:protein FMN transferase [Nocardioides sp. BP30]WGL51065.1 FAD:protein FMN transferase [Nocardioides sp. BP30]
MTLDTMTWTDWSCTMSVTAERRELDLAVTIVDHVVAEVDAAVSRFRADSDLSRINARAGRMTPVGPLAMRLICLGTQVARDTHGAVDPALGHDLVANGYDTDIVTVRRRTAPAAGPRLRRETWRDVRVDRSFSLVGVPAGIALDLGATAKAWTVDESIRRLRRRLDGPALVCLGGDLAVTRPLPGGWRIDVAEVHGGAGSTVILHDGAITTSSTLGRRWRDGDGGERHHLIDPSTGLPARSRWRTASVWAPTALSANVVSAWMLIRPDAAEEALVRHGYGARLVARDGTVATPGAWPDTATSVAS